MWVQPGMYSQNQAILKERFAPLIRVCKELKEHFISIIRHIAKSLEVDVAFEWGVTPPVTFNDEELTKVVWEASQDSAEVLPANPSTAGEDFAFYQERIPGVFAFIGSKWRSGCARPPS